MSGIRAQALALALLAITLNFLQPLAHAALLRDGAPFTLWTAFCDSMTAASGGESDATPVSAKKHECCLGLTHGPAFAEPPSSFTGIERSVQAVPFAVPRVVPGSSSAHDGPNQPRGPPLNS